MAETKTNKIHAYQETEKRFTGKYAATVFDTLRMAYQPYRFLLTTFLVLGFAGRVLLLGNANLVGKWVDDIATNGFSNSRSVHYLLILTSMALGGFVCTMIFRVGFSRISARAISQVYDEVTLRTSRFPMVFFDRTPIGRVVTRFSSDYGNVFRLFGGPLAEFLAIIFDMIVMITLISLAGFIYLPMVAIMGVLNYLIYRANRDELREGRRQLSLSRSPSIAHFSETALGSTTIRSFNKERIFKERFQRLDSNYLSQKWNLTQKVITYAYKMNIMTALLLLCTGVLSYFWLQRGWITVGSLGVALGFISLSSTTVQMFFEWIAQFEEALVGIERLDQYLRMPLEEGAFLPSQSQMPTGHPVRPKTFDRNRSESPTNASVEFKGVWFRYQENLPFVLKGVNFSIKAGERIGVIGRTGSGKSSLIQALFFLYPISEGAIWIDGKPLKDLEAYRRSISYISQDSVIFKGTLRENLSIGMRLKEESLLDALARVGLRNLATREGLNFKLEERGRNLSLGEKQLICIARCLLQNSPVVVMDEATSSVDPQSEELLVRATDEFFAQRTQIIIAHRLSTLKSCNRLLWIDHGTVKMIGAPKDVLKAYTAVEPGLFPH